MVAINQNASSTEKYAGNRRVRKTINNGGLAGNIPNGTTDSCWFGWQTMEERNPFGGSGSTDTPTKEFVWGAYIDECIQIHLLVPAGPQGLPSRHYYLLQDTLYRAAALTNSGGEIQEAYDTDAYGNTLIFTGPGADNTWFTDDDLQSSYGANDIIYCGYRYDAETDNYYVRNRYYSPVLGRWLTRDPIGYRGGINLYGYVESAPVGMVDAEGLAGPAVTGTVSPSTPPTSPPGATPVPPGGTSPTSPNTEPNTGSVGVTGTTGPVPIVPGVTGSAGATGTATSQGNYTGSGTGQINILALKGTKVAVGVTGKVTGKLTKNPKPPSESIGVACKAKVPSIGGLPAFDASMNAAVNSILGGSPGQVGPNYSIGAGVSVPIGSGLQVSGSITHSFGPGGSPTVVWLKVIDSN